MVEGGDQGLVDPRLAVVEQAVREALEDALAGDARALAEELAGEDGGADRTRMGR